MGGNRKNRGGGHHHQQQQPHQHNQSRHSDSSHSSNYQSGSANANNNGSKNGRMDGIKHLDFNKVLQEVDDGLQVTWREILFALLGIALLAVLSIFVGVAAGMTISIHYYESQIPVSVRRMDPRDTSSMYSGPAAYQRVTTLDPMIASSNVLQSRDRDGLDLGKVIMTSASGQLNVLMVVEEVTPLHVDGGASPPSSSSGHGGSSHGNVYTSDQQNASSSTRSAVPMTMEQANLLVPGYSKWKQNQPDIVLRDPTILPTICSDGYTIGFDDWHQLRAAVQEANSISAEKFMRWSAYFANVGRSIVAFQNDDLYYEDDVVFTICPGTTLRARRGPIYINAENVVIECDDCVVDVGGTHLNFGPHARNILVRGVTFRGAHTSSLTFYNDGADASFEDCFWVGNAGVNGKFGAVADVNSTSTVNFYRCEISQGNRGGSGNAQKTQGFGSSLSIRA